MANRTSRISPERQALIVSMYQAGHSRLSAASAAGTTISTVNVILRKHGITEFRTHLSHSFTTVQSLSLAGQYRSGEAIKDLAAAYGCTPSTVRKELDRHRVQRRDDRGRRRLFTVAEYEQMEAMSQRGSSQNEIALALNSARGTIQRVMMRAGIAPARSGAARGARHGGWAGGRLVRADGYVQVLLTPEDPLYKQMADRRGYAFEHRVAVARSLGRPIAEHESIHHVNGDRQDNRIENLQLRQGQHGAGAAFRCLDCGSTNIEAVRLTEFQQIVKDNP